jgi:hypothetical protein
MKTKLYFRILMLACLVCSHHAVAQRPIYPMATNVVWSAYATSGTNVLAAILSGTNVCYQLLSTNGTLVGPLAIIGQGTSLASPKW